MKFEDLKKDISSIFLEIESKQELNLIYLNSDIDNFLKFIKQKEPEVILFSKRNLSAKIKEIVGKNIDLSVFLREVSGSLTNKIKQPERYERDEKIRLQKLNDYFVKLLHANNEHNDFIVEYQLFIPLNGSFLTIAECHYLWENDDDYINEIIQNVG